MWPVFRMAPSSFPRSLVNVVRPDQEVSPAGSCRVHFDISVQNHGGCGHGCNEIVEHHTTRGSWSEFWMLQRFFPWSFAASGDQIAHPIRWITTIQKHEKTDPVQHIILRQLFSIAISSQAPPPPRTPFANFSFSSSMKCTLTNAKGTLSVNLNFFHLGFWHRLPVVPTNRPEAWRRRRRPRPFRHLGRRQGVEEPRRQGGTQDKNRWDGLYDGTFSALAPIQSPARSRDRVRGGAP